MPESVKYYIAILLAVTVVLTLATYYDMVDPQSVLIRISDYIVTLSIALVIFPLVAIPLMFQVISFAAEQAGEKPKQEFYDDFNTACLLVSMGSISELILIFLYKSSIIENYFVQIFIASITLGNLIAFMIIFIIVVLVLQKIVVELKPLLTR